MEKNDLASRMEDLAAQCQRRSVITHSHFLTPAEQHQIANTSCPDRTEVRCCLEEPKSPNERFCSSSPTT